MSHWVFTFSHGAKPETAWPRERDRQVTTEKSWIARRLSPSRRGRNEAVWGAYVGGETGLFYVAASFCTSLITFWLYWKE